MVDSYVSKVGEELGFNVEDKIKLKSGYVTMVVKGEDFTKEDFTKEDFTKEEFTQVLNKYKDRHSYWVRLRLGDLKTLAEEVISKDTGVDVRGKIRMKVDYFNYNVGIQIKEKDLTDEDISQLGEYSLEDFEWNVELVVKNYYSMLGDKGNDRKVSVSKKDVGDDMDDICTVVIKNN